MGGDIPADDTPKTDTMQRAARIKAAKLAASLIPVGGKQAGAAAEASASAVTKTSADVAGGIAKRTGDIANNSATGRSLGTATVATGNRAASITRDRFRGHAVTAAKSRLVEATRGATREGVGDAKSDAKAAASSALKATATGAVQGAIAGSGAAGAGAIPGAVAGALKGLGKSALEEKSIQRTMMRVAAVLIIAAVLLGIAVGSFVGATTQAMLAAQSSNASASAAASGAAQGEIDQALQEAALRGVPFELVLALMRAKQSHINLDALSMRLRHHMPSDNERSLLAGAVMTSDGGMKLGEDAPQVALAENAETGFIAALVDVGLPKTEAKHIFSTAREWALGTQYGCGSAEQHGTAVPAQTTAAADGALQIPGWGVLDADQSTNASLIVAAVKAYFPNDPAAMRQAGIISLGTAMRESTLRNLGYGDWETSGVTNPDGSRTTSIGLFQQQDSWGTREQRLDPVWATAKFLSVLVTHHDWQQMAPGHASLAVQVFDASHVGQQAEFEQLAAPLWDALSRTAPPVEIPKDLATATGSPGGPGGTGTGETCIAAPAGATPGAAGLPIDPASGAAISDWYGPREAPCGGCSSFHRGLDVSAPGGTPIYAIADGTVVETGYTEGKGYFTLIDHGGGVLSDYFHQMELSTSVKAGDAVKTGQQIGRVGTTGPSSGDHLHLTIIMDGEQVDPVPVLLGWGVPICTAYPISASNATAHCS